MPKREAVKGKARLTISVSGKPETVYTLHWLDPNPEVAYPAWRLTKADGTSYDVALLPHGAECTCEDFIWCRANKDPKGCKHCAALRAVGLLKPGGGK